MDKFEKIYKQLIKALYFCGMLLVFFPSKNARSFSVNDVFPFFSRIAKPLSVPIDHCDPGTPTSYTPFPSGFTVSPITPDIESVITGVSYPEDCPVPLSELCHITVLHMGFDGLVHPGELIVHKEIAGTILEIFFRLYEAGYPIEQIRLIDVYGADDEASMTANNTSAFCFRTIAGTDTLSLHSYGLAIDINPLYNPYVSNGVISPSISPYDHESGLVHSPYFMTEQDLCVQLFKAYGFIWGGDWDSPTDYQHFEYAETAAR